MADRHADLLIIGAGIVGLATALEYTRRFPGKRLLVVEKEDRVAAHQTGHNSGVIHSGLYYRTGSLKARNCVAGCASMKRFCQEHAIPLRGVRQAGGGDRARRSSAPATVARARHGQRRRASAHARPRRVPRDRAPLRGICALHVPSTGIVDYTEVAKKYAELIERAGGEIVFAPRSLACATTATPTSSKPQRERFARATSSTAPGFTATPSPAWRVAKPTSRSFPSAASTTR